MPDARRVADGSAFVLVVVVLIINGLARYIGARIERKMKRCYLICCFDLRVFLVLACPGMRLINHG